MTKIAPHQAIKIFRLKYHKELRKIFDHLGEPPFDVLCFESQWAEAVSHIAVELEMSIGKEQAEKIVFEEMENILSFIKEYGNKEIK